MNRRGFLKAILATGVAPYVSTMAGVLMPPRGSVLVHRGNNIPLRYGRATLGNVCFTWKREDHSFADDHMIIAINGRPIGMKDFTIDKESGLITLKEGVIQI